MKRIALWFCSTATGVVLLFSYHTSTGGSVSAARPAAAAAGVVSSSAPPAPSSSAGSSAASPSPSASATTASVVVNGQAVSTRYGDIQVQITVRGKRIVKATALEYPTEGRDGEINSYAIPILEKATLSAQNASIDTVSGATYTSEGYVGSLQSALDAAHV